MLVGYVSDEQYLALPDVGLAFRNGDQIVATRSLADGAVVADLAPGTWQVTMAKEGFGSKRVELNLPAVAPHQFRLLSDALLGYVWPKWRVSGTEAEFRVHSTTAYKLSLWRYGWEKELVQDLGW